MKHTDPEQEPAAAAHLHDLMEEISVAMVTTVTPDGALRSRPMFTRQLKDERELWFLTSDESEIATDLADEPGINVSYSDVSRDRFVSVTGQGDLVHDASKVRKLWQPSLERYFPRGVDDPHLVLLRVRVEYAEYWDATKTRMRRAAGRKPPPKASGAEPAGETGHVKVDVREARTSG